MLFSCLMANLDHDAKIPACLCGCGGNTKGGRYLPGHDAKHKSALIRAALGGGKRAEKKIGELGWTKFLEKARGKAVKLNIEPKRIRRCSATSAHTSNPREQA